MQRYSENEYIIKLLEDLDKKLSAIQRRINKNKAKVPTKSMRKIR
jgi:hypothetical protein